MTANQVEGPAIHVQGLEKSYKTQRDQEDHDEEQHVPDQFEVDRHGAG
jgi:hypothetical protein